MSSEIKCKTAVVILGWNGLPFIQKFLKNVVKRSTFEGVRIVYADNCSTDNSVQFIKTNFPEVHILINSTNGGYAAGYNEALSKIDAEYFVLLNQDVEVEENWLVTAIDFLDQNQHIGALQPKILWYDYPDTFEYAGAAGGMMDFMGYPFCRGRIFESFEKDQGQYNSACEIFWATGACLFVRKDSFFQAGKLDPDFFAHQEEIDLCWRIQLLNQKIFYYPKSTVYHVGGGSLARGNPKKTYLNFRNNLAMLTKNSSLSKIFWLLPLRILLDMVAASVSILQNKNFGDFKAILKAHFHFWLNFVKWFKKRSKNTDSKVNFYNRSILWQYFIYGKKKFTDLPQN